jgi:RNA polymerase sigma-70 factor (ECF subfamily)
VSAVPADLQALLARVALGDQRAFEQLYRATSAHLLGIAHGVMQQRERAEEVLQEAYLAVWHSAGSYQAALATPMTWLINIVRNKAIDRVRSGAALRGVHVSLHDECGEEALQLPDAAERQPQRLAEAAFVRARIDGCMAGLAAAQRQALALAFFRGLVHAEIAAALGAPLGTVKAWVRRGSERMRECLQAAGVGGAA